MRRFWPLTPWGLLLVLWGCHLSYFPGRSGSQLAASQPFRIEWGGDGVELPPQEAIPLALKALPRDRSQVDWVRAVREGYIAPKGSIREKAKEDSLLDLDIVLIVMDPLLPDVIFSHAVHTYWLDCESCHPKIFTPKKEGNYYTMQDIWEGRSCGRCHGTVAFPTKVGMGAGFNANCLKCHNRKRGYGP
ncbi:MAG: cytochrome c3 family protein [Candidatus Tectomicrobia bacterium]|uniref:Cytochrome c3 family protein n=1 Tax=Tectimicrobiota bacterium TaxID=2528274 RepID=A0A932CPW4_UNCTE|nr:cytochrome c3 family protein [Candidatus Tectomicrobia bacterium]